MTIDGKKQIIDDFWLEHQDPESLYIPSNYGVRFGMILNRFKLQTRSLRLDLINEESLAELMILLLLYN